MERTKEETFDGSLHGVHLVRPFVVTVLTDHPCRDDAVLIASELASNAVRHALTASFRVRLEVEDGLVRVSVVADTAHNGIPHIKSKTMTHEGGRGLFLVDALANEWGFAPNGNDMTVWAELGLAPVS